MSTPHPMLYLAVWLLISNHDCDTYQTLKRTTLSICCFVAIGLFTYERAESQIYRAQDSQTIPVKLKQLLPTVKAVDSVGMTG